MQGSVLIVQIQPRKHRLPHGDLEAPSPQRDLDHADNRNICTTGLFAVEDTTDHDMESDLPVPCVQVSRSLPAKPRLTSLNASWVGASTTNVVMSVHAFIVEQNCSHILKKKALICS